MKIGYVKRAKINNRRHKYYMNVIVSYLKSIFNVVEQDKYRKDIWVVYNFNESSRQKLIRKLKSEGIDFAIVEKDYKIDYETIDTKFSTRAILPELVSQCYELVKPIIDEIYICTNNFCNENIKIIRELVPKIKTINIVTNNKKYHSLEHRLEEEGIYITVSNNKRKSLKNASIMINLDFEYLNEYNINRDMIIIDTTGKIEVQKGFNGIVISKVKLDTKKVLRVFSEFDNFDKSELIEGEIAKIGDYNEVREFVKFNKIYIESLYHNRKLDLKEFERIKVLMYKKYQKKNPTRFTSVNLVGDEC